MPAKLEWGRSQKWVKSEVRLGDCDCIVTVNLYGEPGDELAAVDVPPARERLARGWISIFPIQDKAGRVLFLIHVHVANKHGFYDWYGVTFSFYEAVVTALELARIMVKWRDGRIKSHDKFIDLLSDVVEENNISLAFDDVEKQYKLIPFTPAEARRAMYTIEKAIQDLAKENR